jgi:hypothetical protein
MKTRIFLLFALLLFSYTRSQAQHDTIQIVKNKYILDGKALRPNQMLDLMKDYPDAYNSMKKAKTNYNVAMTFAFAGGFCVGYSLAGLFSGNESSWILTGVGAGLIVAGLPFNKAYNSNAKMAIRLYNSKIRQVSCNEVQFYFGVTENGVGFICKL